LQDAAVLAADILISPMPPEMAVIKELERGTLSMLSDLQSYKNMGINVPSLFGVIYKVDRTKDAKQFIEYLNNPTKDKFYTMLNTQIPQAVALLLDFALVEGCLVALFIAFLSLKLTLRLQLHYFVLLIIVSHSKTLATHGISSLTHSKTKNHIVQTKNHIVSH
jgi:hypothetical protein